MAGRARPGRARRQPQATGGADGADGSELAETDAEGKIAFTVLSKAFGFGEFK